MKPPTRQGPGNGSGGGKGGPTGPRKPSRPFGGGKPGGAPRGERPASGGAPRGEGRPDRNVEARGDRPQRSGDARPQGGGDARADRGGGKPGSFKAGPKRPGGGGGYGSGRPGGGGRKGPPAAAIVGMPARALAADLAAAVFKGKILDQLLDTGKLADRYQLLEPRDRALARAIVATTLRRNGQISDAIGRFLERPLPEDLLQLKAIMHVAAAQVLFMGIADHASVAIAVEQVDADRDCRPFKGVANAILRRVAREKDLILADQDAVKLNTPEWLLSRWTETYGEETARAIAAAHMVEPSLDLTVKSDPEGWAARLGGIVLPTGSVRVVVQGAVEKIDGYDEGAWWVQDAAATLPVRLLGDVKDKKVGDLCAAPGGKTALLAHLGAKVTSVDSSGHRLQRLRRNLFRLELPADTVMADATEWMGSTFDMILLDAPCTATGTMRRHPDGAFLKGPESIATLAGLQRRLLDHAIRMLRPGGLLVYSTCSLEPEEGPDQIRRLLLIDAPVERVPVSADEVFGLSELITPDGDVRTLPIHLPNPDPRLAGMDGFFAARLRRKA